MEKCIVPDLDNVTYALQQAEMERHLFAIFFFYYYLRARHSTFTDPWVETKRAQKRCGFYVRCELVNKHST